MRPDVQPLSHASSGYPMVVASLDVPISINGLKRTLKHIKERHGSQVQIVPHENRIDFVRHERGKVPK